LYKKRYCIQRTSEDPREWDAFCLRSDETIVEKNIIIVYDVEDDHISSLGDNALAELSNQKLIMNDMLSMSNHSTQLIDSLAKEHDIDVQDDRQSSCEFINSKLITHGSQEHIEVNDLMLNINPHIDIGSSVNPELYLNINGTRYVADLASQTNKDNDAIISQNHLVHYLNAISQSPDYGNRHLSELYNSTDMSSTHKSKLLDYEEDNDEIDDCSPYAWENLNLVIPHDIESIFMAESRNRELSNSKVLDNDISLSDNHAKITTSLKSEDTLISPGIERNLNQSIHLFLIILLAG
jgi:hypothetical protein